MINARWAARRCLEAKGRGDIAPAEDKIARIITYDLKNDAGDEAPETPDLKPYSVCDRVGNRGGLLRAGLLGGG